MEEIRIKVNSLPRAKRMIKELAEQAGVMDVALVPSASPRRIRKATSSHVDPVTLASEASLAQDWNSPEDDVWDDHYKALCIEKAI